MCKCARRSQTDKLGRQHVLLSEGSRAIVYLNDNRQGAMP